MHPSTKAALLPGQAENTPDQAATDAAWAALEQRLAGTPDRWGMAARAAREWSAIARMFPAQPRTALGQWRTIPTSAGPLRLWIVRPQGAVRAVHLYFHGGGWIGGSAADQDTHLERLAGEFGIATVGVEYRLAPEHPYPCGPDDCETAALWLVQHAQAEFGSRRLLLSGGSSGAHLAALTLLRLRERHALSPFAAVSLVNGWFDLSLTPGARCWTDRPLVIDTRDLRMFVAWFLQNGEDTRSSAVSPVYADLRCFPPALLSVGTRDPLLDDSLLLSARLHAAGVPCELAVYLGSAHGFTRLPADPNAGRALRRIEDFLASHV